MTWILVEDMLASCFGQVLDEFGMCFLMLEVDMAWGTAWHKPCRKVCRVFFYPVKNTGWDTTWYKPCWNLNLSKMVHGERYDHASSRVVSSLRAEKRHELQHDMTQVVLHVVLSKSIWEAFFFLFSLHKHYK